MQKYLKSPEKTSTYHDRLNRATFARLHGLKGWLPTVEVEEIRLVATQQRTKPWHEGAGTESAEFYEATITWKGGWHVLSSSDVLHASPEWAWSKVTRPKGSARFKRYRLWAGQCEVCKKYTISTSTNFLKGLRCAHCNPPQKRQAGGNLFIGGTIPSDGRLHLIRAKKLEEAEAIAAEMHLTWVISAYAGRTSRALPIPTLPKDPTTRPRDAWAFPVDDVPPASEYSPETWPQAEPATYWEGPDGRTYSWYTCPVVKLYQEPEYRDTQDDPVPETPPETPTEVSFDDLF